MIAADSPAPAPPAPPPQTAAAPAAAPVATDGKTPPLLWALTAACLVALLLALALLWQKVGNMQEQLARQSAEATRQSVQANTLAQQAQQQVREALTRQATLEARLNETALQRSQIDALVQTLNRSRDENLVAELESYLRLAQQQAGLAASVEPMLAALKTADQRLGRAAQPRLLPVQRAIARDIERIRSASLTDLPGLLARLDELARATDNLPLVNDVARRDTMPKAAASPVETSALFTLPPWLQRLVTATGRELRQLVRVHRIDHPEAMLVSPEQAFFLRENLKFRLLNARMGLLARQPESVRADLRAAADAVNHYFDPSSTRTQHVATVLQQVQAQARSIDLPRFEDTFAALALAAGPNR